MIETLQIDVTLLSGLLQVMGASVFILLLTSLIKDKIPMYTPHIAIGMGSILGLILMIIVAGFDGISILAGVMLGANFGAAAVGYHQAVKQVETKQEEVVELPDEINQILYEN